MSALHPKADIDGARWNVRFVPKADMHIKEGAPHNRFSPLRFRPIRMCSGTVARAGVGNTPDRAARVISDQ